VIALAALSTALAAGLVAPSARAGAALFGGERELDPFDTFVDRLLGEPLAHDAPGRALAVGVDASLRVSSEGASSFGALAFFQVPFERLLAPPRRALTSFSVAQTPRAARAAPAAAAPPISAPPPTASPPAAPVPRSTKREASPPSSPAPPSPAPASTPAPSTEAADTSAPAVVLSPALARGAVRAACKAARLDEADARLDGLASRAKTSALLPELRLRATRVIDESESLAPTEYDPARRTASGAATTWLEARATFRLDRLVFADDEIAVERLRLARATERTKLVAKVLELLDAWQRAHTTVVDPGAKPEAQVRAALAVAATEASLDVLTNGWFSRAIVRTGEPVATSDAGVVGEADASHDAAHDALHPLEEAPPLPQKRDRSP